LPRPDGVNIPREYHFDPNNDKNPGKYYTKRSAEANEMLQAGKPVSDVLQQDIPQVNIEAILPLWSDDLTPYFEALVKQNAFEGMRIEEKEILTGDKGKWPKSGWVVELRGFTYYRPLENGKPIEPRQFLKDILCNNLSAGKFLGDP